MDINSYNFTPTLLDCSNMPLMEYKNDDMCMELYKYRSYDHFIYHVSAQSYDGQLEVEESFTTKQPAESLYKYIYESFTDTPPADGEIETFLKSLKAA